MKEAIKEIVVWAFIFMSSSTLFSWFGMDQFLNGALTAIITINFTRYIFD